MADDEVRQALWDAIGDRIDAELTVQMRSVSRDASKTQIANDVQIRLIAILLGQLWAHSGQNVGVIEHLQEMLEEKSEEDERYKAASVLSGWIAKAGKDFAARESLPPSDDQ